MPQYRYKTSGTSTAGIGGLENLPAIDDSNLSGLNPSMLVSPLGIEPRTYGLKVRCSTD